MLDGLSTESKESLVSQQFNIAITGLVGTGLHKTSLTHRYYSTCYSAAECCSSTTQWRAEHLRAAHSSGHNTLFIWMTRHLITPALCPCHMTTCVLWNTVSVAQVKCETRFQLMKRIAGVIINVNVRKKSIVDWNKSKTHYIQTTKEVSLKISGFVGCWLERLINQVDFYFGSSFSNLRTCCCFSVRYGQLVWQKMLFEDANLGPRASVWATSYISAWMINWKVDWLTDH